MLLVELNHNTLKLRQSQFLENLDPLMATYYTASRPVPDHWLDIAELLQRALELLIFWISRLEILPWIVVRWKKLLYSSCFNGHLTIPHSANFSKPSMKSMKALAISTISE